MPIARLSTYVQKPLNFSILELAHKMLELAAEYPDYADSEKPVKLVDVKQLNKGCPCQIEDERLRV